jgi:hypothetical protein
MVAGFRPLLKEEMVGLLKSIPIEIGWNAF